VAAVRLLVTNTPGTDLTAEINAENSKIGGANSTTERVAAARLLLTNAAGTDLTAEIGTLNTSLGGSDTAQERVNKLLNPEWELEASQTDLTVAALSIKTRILAVLAGTTLGDDGLDPSSKMKCNTLMCLLETQIRKGAANEKIQTIKL